MKNLKNVGGAWRTKRAPGWLLAACIAAVLPLTSHAVPESPAQKPLTSREGGSTKPNIILTIDESGSMGFQYLPEGTFKVGAYSVTFPQSTTLLMHPDDPRNPSVAGIGVTVPYGGIPLADVSNTTNVYQRQMRSGDVNKQYYDPKELYLPWMNVDGTRMANASFNAARWNPLVTTGTGIATDLAVKFTTATKNAKWCTANNSCTTGNQKFNPAIYYVLGTTGGAYKDPGNASNYTLVDLNAITADIPGGSTLYPARTDCSASVCTVAQEKQNFANWFQYYRSRVLAAQAGIPEAMQPFDDRLRVGWGRLKKAATTIDGVSTAVVEAGVRNFDTTQKAAFFNWMRNITVYGGTPLREAMYGVGKYFERSDNAGPWGDNPGSTTSGPHKTCRRSYNILVTDGYWNDYDVPLSLPNLGNVDNTSVTTGIAPNGYKYTKTRPYLDANSNTLADVAMYFWNRDLRSNVDNKVLPTADNPAYWQHMVNYTVGFGVTGTLNPATDLPDLASGVKAWGTDKIDDLWHAAVNSRGQYFSANNAGELAAAIRSSLNDAVERDLREAGVAAAATVLEDGNRKYIPKYRTGVWSGDVEAYQLDAKGQAGAKVWSASARLPAWDSRKIFTWDPTRVVGTTVTPAGVPFDWAGLSTPSQTLMTNGNTALVNFIRGDRSAEGAASPAYRKRDGIIGDIVNSTPVFVKDGNVEPYTTLPNIGDAYGTFLTEKAKRVGVLYVGGNGGMLHGFRDTKGIPAASAATDGTEVFAYVPRAGYPYLTKLTEQDYGGLINYHRFFVDGPLSERDAYVRAPGAGAASWRNYLVGSMGAGGRAVFALDVTDPTALGASTIRWEIASDTHPELGYIAAPIQVGVVDDGSTNGKWVAIFGNGYVADDEATAYLFVVGLQDGSVTKLQISTKKANGLGGVSLKRNSFGQIESLYAGDLQGSLWKLDWNKGSGAFVVANAGKAIFEAPNKQPIVQPPLIKPHADGDWVVFGTGRLLTLGDADASDLQALYGLRLKTTDSLGVTAKQSDLVARTIATFTGADGSPYFDLNGTAVDWSTTSFRGWSIDLSVSGYSGLRTAYAPQLIAGDLAFFSLIAPAQNVAECDQATGRGINLIFPIETGLSADQCILDTSGDDIINSSDRCDVAGYATSADGVDAVLRGKTGTPVCDASECKETTEYSVQNTTGGRNLQYTRKYPKPSTPTTAKDRVWRRLVNPPIR